MAGRFQKGQSGNPSGRKPDPPELREIEALARSHAPQAIERLAYWMAKDDARASVAASLAMLNRGFGTPQQTVTATIEDNRSVVRLPDVSATPEAWQTTHKPH